MAFFILLRLSVFHPAPRFAVSFRTVPFRPQAPALCPMPPTTTAPGERKEGIPGGSHPTGQKVGTGIGLVTVSDNGMALRLPLLILTGSHGLS